MFTEIFIFEYVLKHKHIKYQVFLITMGNSQKHQCRTNDKKNYNLVKIINKNYLCTDQSNKSG